MSDDGQHTKIVASAENLLDAEIVVGPKNLRAPMLYQGTGIITEPTNPLILSILTADSTAYSYNPNQPVVEVKTNY